MPKADQWGSMCDKISRIDQNVVQYGMRSQFHNVFATLMFPDSSGLPSPSSILNEKTHSGGKVHRNCYSCFSILNRPEPPPSSLKIKVKNIVKL